MTINCKPLVSVIIPTYNRANILGRSIQSVLDQSYQDLELIIVDDGSSDNTEEVVRAFKDPRIRFLCHEQNRGVSAARNTGIRAARGEYIAFNDSDDEWLPTKLERQMELFDQDKTGSLGLVTCGVLMKNATREWHFKVQQHLLNYEELLYNRRREGISTIRLLVKRALAEAELYFDEFLPAIEDWDFVLRLSRIVSIGAISDSLVIANRVEGPHADVSPNRVIAELAILQKYAVELKARPKTLGNHHESIALDYYKHADMHHARDHFKAAIRAYPWRPVTYFFFFSSLFGYNGLSGFLIIRSYSRELLRRIKSRFGLAEKNEV